MGDADVNEDGFSLVEMMVAIFLITVGLLALVGEFATTLRAQHQQKLHAQALRLATASVEDARQLPFSSLLGLASTLPTSTPGSTFTQSTSVKVCSPSDSGSQCTTPAVGAPAAVRLSVDVAWKDGSAQHHVTLGTSVTDDTTKLLAASGSSSSLLGGSGTSNISVTLGTLSLSPSTVATDANGTPAAPIVASLSVTGLNTASSFPLTWSDDTGSHQVTMTSSGTNTFSATIPANQVTRKTARGSVVFAATVPGSAALPSATLTTVQAPALSGTCTLSPAVIALRTLTTVSAAAETLSCTATGLATTDSVKVAWTTASGTSTATMTSTNGTAWSVVLPAGSPMRLLTVPFTFTPVRASDGVSGAAQTVTAVAA